MLISALCDYYDILAKNGKIIGEEYSKVPISFCIELTPEGQMSGIIDLRIPTKNAKGKTDLLPKECIMPRRTEKPGIDANMAEHRPLYIFGLDYDKKSGKFSTLIEGKTGEAAKKPIKSHDAFKSYIENLDGIDTPVVNAFRNFVSNWIPENELENPLLIELGKLYSSSYYCFCLAGHPELTLHEDSELLKRWEHLYATKMTVDSDAVVAQCSVMGENLPIARIHDSITGIFGGLTTGSKLVCFKSRAEFGYGIEQSYNSNISTAAMKKYTAALNMLLADKKHKALLDDITVVYWALDMNDLYCNVFSDSVFGGSAADALDAAQAEENIGLAMKSAREGSFGLKSLNPTLENNTEFYIAGLKPNSSRIAVKFVYHCRFGELFRNIALHDNDIRPFEKAKPIKLWQLRRELVNPSSDKDTVDPALISKILDSIITGYNYPEFMLAKVLQRIKADIGKSQEESSVKFDALNPTRIGMIKAYINRKSRLAGQKEEIGMSLDINNNNPAYLCGRLFAVLEDAQLCASSGKLNRTIKDAYFSSAMSNPSVIMPQLVKRAQYHIEKLDNPDEIKKQIGFIMNQLGTEFPKNLPLTEQGKFVLGYYHQSSNINYKKKKEEDD